jgi:hypothetical protein
MLKIMNFLHELGKFFPEYQPCEGIFSALGIMALELGESKENRGP